MSKRKTPPKPPKPPLDLSGSCPCDRCYDARLQKRIYIALYLAIAAVALFRVYRLWRSP